VPEGYYVYRSGMNSVMITLRAFVPEASKMAETVAHLEQTRIYPFDSAIKAKPMVFPDASKPGLTCPALLSLIRAHLPNCDHRRGQNRNEFHNEHTARDAEILTRFSDK